jgi:hypothetical protein
LGGVMRSERTRVAAYCLPAAKLVDVAFVIRTLQTTSNCQLHR